MTTTSSTPDDWANKVEDLRQQSADRRDDIVGHAAKSTDDFKTRASTAADDLKAKASAHADNLKESAQARAADFKASAEANSQTIRDSANAIATDLKSQANAQLEDAKGVISSMADEARSRIAGIIDEQKALGADKLTGISRAAHNAADDLNGQNPHVAKLVRDAAGSVDMIAGNLRSSNISDVIASVSSFARKQPVAFFAGSVLAGFALARFIKSEPTASQSPGTEPQQG